MLCYLVPNFVHERLRSVVQVKLLANQQALSTIANETQRRLVVMHQVGQSLLIQQLWVSDSVIKMMFQRRDRVLLTLTKIEPFVRV